MPFDPKVQAQLSTITNKKLQLLREEMSILRQLLEICESPLEQKLLLGFIDTHIPGSRFYNGYQTSPPRSKSVVAIQWNLKYPTLGPYPKITETRIIIEPQHHINITIDPTNEIYKNYRADFLITQEVRLELSKHYTQISALIVEVDGHEFHERTKEQAQRDRERDRILVQAGYTVFRFTGSEIYHNLNKAIDSIMVFLNSRSSEALLNYQKEQKSK
jgi:very-short-patch-repair endonuclease